MLALPTSLYSPSQRAAIDSKESCHTMLKLDKDVSSFREELESLGLSCNESEAFLLQQDNLYVSLNNLKLVLHSEIMTGNKM